MQFVFQLDLRFTIPPKIAKKIKKAIWMLLAYFAYRLMS